MFSVIAVLKHFLLSEALKDSKIPYLFFTQCRTSSFSKEYLAVLFFVIKKMNQLNYHRKIIFLHLSKIWGKMELPGMNYSSFKKTRGFNFGIAHPGSNIISLTCFL